MEFNLTGKRVLVTAGASGIGRVIAEQFADAGARAIVCDVSEASLKGFAADRSDILGARADVSNPDEVAELFRRIRETYGGLDVLVNNAGISGPTRAVEEITPQEWTETLAVNVTGQFLTVREAVPGFKRQGHGVITNISSTAGRVGMPLRAPYSTSKYAVRGLTDVLAVELGEYNIRVNAILPGIVDGARGRRVIGEQAAAAGLSLEEYLPRLLHNVSMHTMVSAADVANLALFLASDLGCHISGQSISVCGNLESYRRPLTGTTRPAP